MPRRCFLSLALGLLALILLPVSASGFISTGPGDDYSWYWSNPLPQGNDLLAQSWVTPQLGWEVGRNGVVLKTTDGGATWAHQDPRISPDQRYQVDLTGVAFSSSSVGWIVGGTGLVKKTSDGGSTWTTVTASSDIAMASPKAIAVNGARIIVVGSSGGISYSSDGGATWANAATNPARTSGYTLSSIAWSGPSTAYAVGDNGTIQVTTDGGATWTKQTSPTSVALYGVSFAPSSTVGFAVGTVNGTSWTMLRTINGSTWTSIASQAGLALHSVSVLDTTHVAVSGANGAVYLSANANAAIPTWTNATIGQMSGPAIAARSIRYIDSTHVNVVGDYGATYYSADTGGSWTTQSASVTSNLLASWFTDSNHGWVAGAGGTIERTVNGGVTWVGGNVGTGTWRGIAFGDSLNGCVVGDSGAIRRTTNGGETWTSVSSGVTTQLNSAWFSSVATGTGVAVGSGGVILRTTNGGLTWTRIALGATTRNLYGVYFRDATHGWVVGAQNAIVALTSYDGGLTWTWTLPARPSGIGANKTYYAVCGIPGTTNAWVVGQGGLMMSTANGTTWTARTSLTGTTQNLYSVYFRDTSHGWISGAAGTIRRSTSVNGSFTAATTSGLPSGTTIGINSVCFPADANTGYYAADSGTLRKSTDGGANWLSQQYGTYSQLNCVEIGADASHGWIGGNSGLVLVTRDGGNSWVAQTSGTNGNVYGVAFADNDNGWFVGGGGAIGHTANGGVTWGSQTSNTTSQLNGVACYDAAHAIAVGAGGTIRYTLNGGSTWLSPTSMPVLSAGDAMMAVAFPETSTPGVAFVAVNHTANNGHPGILRTTDYGATWTSVMAEAQPMAAISFVPSPNADTGWAAGAAGAMYKTTDGGATWSAQTTPLTTPFTGVSAVTTTSAFAVGQYGFAVQTADGGDTWLLQNTGYGSLANPTNRLLAVDFANINRGYAVGSGGTILRTTSQEAPVTGVAVSPESPDGESGWYRATLPQITLTPDQQAQTYYSWDSESGPFSAYAEPLTAAEGEHTLWYYSVNAANRVEIAKSTVLLTDMTDPSVPGTPTATPIDRSTIQLAWLPATDSYSGIDHYEVYCQMGPTGTPALVATTTAAGLSAMVTDLTPNTEYLFWVVAVDVAGNSSDPSDTSSANTLALEPLLTIAAAFPNLPDGANGWYVTTPTVMLTSLPATVPANTYYVWDSPSGASATYTVPVAVPSPGAHTLYYASVDQANQRVRETTESYAIQFDPTPPSTSTVSASGSATDAIHALWSAATDAQSGIDHYVVVLDGAVYGTYSGTDATVTGLAANSEHSIAVGAVNGAGLSATSTAVVARTMQNPAVSTVSSRTPSVPDGANGWYRSDVAISLSSEPSSVPAYVYAGWDGSALSTYTPGALLSMPSDGEHALRFRSVDQGDSANGEATQTLVLKRDLVAPSIPATLEAHSHDTTSIAVSWSVGADSASGVDHYVVWVDGVAQVSTAETGTIVTGLMPASLHEIALSVVDVAGNESGQTTPVMASAAAGEPLITAVVVSPSAPDGTNGWYRSNPSISLAASTALVPAWDYYWWDESESQTYTVPFGLPSNGTHTLSFFAVDQAHEHAPEATRQITFKLDETSATAPGSVLASPESTNTLSISWSAAEDVESGVDHYEVWVAGASRGTTTSTTMSVGGFQPNHTYSAYVVAVNGAGLCSSSAATSGTTYANTAVSTLASITPAAPGGANGWYLVAPTVTLASQPPTIPATTRWAWDGSAMSVYAASLLVPSEGAHELRYYSVDDADPANREATQTLEVKYDAADPGPPASVLAAAVDTTSISVTWSVSSDTGSGVDHYRLFVDGAEWGSVAGTGTVVSGFEPESLHSFYVEAVDAAGRVSAAGPTAMAVTESAAPLVTTALVSPAGPDGSNGWYVTTPTVTFTVLPSIAATTYYSWDGGPTLSATGSLMPPGEGEHELSYWSVDRAGFRVAELPRTLMLKVDLSPDVRVTPSVPSITLSKTFATDTQVGLSWTPAPIPPSGIDHYEVWDEYLGSTASTAYIVSGLEPLTSYGFAVYAISGAGVAYSQSETLTVETSPTPLPQPPSIVAVRAPNGDHANIAWEPASTYVGPMGYHVWRSANGVDFSVVATLAGQLSSNYIDTGLRSSTRYWYAVSTFDDRGESTISDVSAPAWKWISAITGPPERVGTLESMVGSGTVLLSWVPNQNPAVVEYLVTRADYSLAEGTTLPPVPVSGEGTETFIDDAVDNGQTYYYRVYPVDASGTVGYGSIEAEARPHGGYDGDDTHVFEPDGTGRICRTCHGQHDVGVDSQHMWLVGGPNETNTCMRCHSLNSGLASTDTSSELDDPKNEIARLPIWTENHPEHDKTCSWCHRMITSETSPAAGLMSAGGTKMSGFGGLRGDDICMLCHSAGTTLRFGDLSGFETGLHYNVEGPASGSNVKCVVCHESHAGRNYGLTRYAGYMVCMQCHNPAKSDAKNPDIWSRLTLDESPNAKLPLLPQDQTTGARMQCQNCHNTMLLTANSLVVDPHDPSGTGLWKGNLNGDQKSFCFTCHDGQPLPTSAETTPWASAVFGQGGISVVQNLSAVWSSNVHGDGLPSDPATTNAYLRADMGYKAGDSLDCKACHDPHGTMNNWALKTTIVSADGNKRIDGIPVFEIPAGSITPTSPVGYDYRFWCAACHVFDPATHDAMAPGSDTSVMGTSDCNECHHHMHAYPNSSEFGL